MPQPAKRSTACRHAAERAARLLLLFLLCVTGWGSAASAQTYYRSTARPVDSIATAFPYDIELLASTGPGADTAWVRSDALLAQHRGRRPVLMLFWLTTCGPCRQELAEIARRMDGWAAAADFAFVPVSLDFPKRRAAFHARAAVYPWTSYLDVDREFPLVMPGELNGVPQLFLFDAAGRQVFHRRKFRLGDLEALEAALGIE